jgi:lipopolysaccharide export system permease protein
VIKKLDLYIIKKFLGTFGFMIAAFVIIAMVFDVSENIDDFVKSKAPFGRIILDYYLNFCLYFGNLLSSFIIFLTIIWFTSKLAQKTEIVAILCGGISYRRFMRPYFITATFLVITSLVLSHYIVPKANARKLDFELDYLKKAITVDEKNMHRELEPGTIAFFQTFTPGNYGGSMFSMEKWKDGKLTYKLLSSGASLDTITGVWTINSAQIREWKADGSETVRYKLKLDTILPMTIEDFGLRVERMNTMSWSQLNEYIDYQRMSGTGRVALFELEKYNRTASAFSIYVLTLIGVTIASRKSRGGTGLHLMLAVVVGFIFIFISRITAVSAMNLGFPAYLAVWIPNVIFALLGIFLYKRAQK